MSIYLVEVGVRGRSHKDTAFATGLGGTSLNKNVTIHTPVRAPRVLDLVVVSAIKSTVTNSKDTVVKIGTASASKNTTRVELESGLVSLDGNRDGLLNKGRHKSFIRVLLHIGVRGDLQLGVVARGVVLAVTILASGTGGVRVVRLGAKTAVVLDPLEGIVHKTTIASVITKEALVARHKLLLGEGLEVIVSDLVDTLKSTSGRERPARTALALVLDRGHGTLGFPVNRGRKRGNIRRSFMDVVSLLVLRSLD
jgi:hypothetical protein